jgi:hypothetical protein
MKISITAILVFIASVFAFHSVKAQSPVRSDSVVQFSGIILDELGHPLFGAVLSNMNRSKKAVSQANGTFSFPVVRGDKVEITFLGYPKRIVTIPKDLDGSNFIQTIQVRPDTFVIPGITIHRYVPLDSIKFGQVPQDPGESAGFHRMNHAPVYKKPIPVLNPISSISNAVQNSRMKHNKGGLDAYHQGLMIKDFYKDDSPAVPDSIMRQYKP